MKKKSFFVLSFMGIGILVFNFTIISFAQNPCKEDVAKYCSDVQSGGGRIINCLKEHYKDLSQECYECLAKVKPGSGNAPAKNSGEKPSEGEGDSSQQ